MTRWILTAGLASAVAFLTATAARNKRAGPGEGRRNKPKRAPIETFTDREKAGARTTSSRRVRRRRARQVSTAFRSWPRATASS